MVIRGLVYNGVGDLLIRQERDNFIVQSTELVSCKFGENDCLCIKGKSSVVQQGNQIVIHGNGKNDLSSSITYRNIFYVIVIGFTIGLTIETCPPDYNCFPYYGFIAVIMYVIVKCLLPTDSPGGGAEEDDEYKKEWVLGDTQASLSSIEMNGAGTFSLPCTLLSDEEVNLRLTGTMEVQLETTASLYNTERVKISCTGNGSINVAQGRYRANSLKVSSIGNGAVRGFHAIRQCSTSAIGCSTIGLTKSQHCQTSKQSIGLSTVRIRTCV